MDGIHDLGGMAGFGAVEVERDEPRFHESWEATAFRLLNASVALLRAFNADEYRHAVERMDPAHYLAARYYERMLTGVTTLLVEKGFVDVQAVEALAGGRVPLARPARANAPDGVDAKAAPRFANGDRVRVRELRQPGHTRAPRYVHGHAGVVVHVAPPFPYPDASAHSLPGREEPTYHVAFDAAELWGEAADPGASVVVDLWETYLEPDA